MLSSFALVICFKFLNNKLSWISKYLEYLYDFDTSCLPPPPLPTPPLPQHEALSEHSLPADKESTKDTTSDCTIVYFNSGIRSEGAVERNENDDKSDTGIFMRSCFAAFCLLN